MERSRRQFSQALKQRIVEALEAGHLLGREAARTVQTSAAMVHRWLEEFGRYKPKRNVAKVTDSLRSSARRAPSSPESDGAPTPRTRVMRTSEHS